jgi:hypothetical protein
VNLIVIFMTCTCIVMHSLFCQLPNFNLFIQHVIYLYGKTPLVNCGPQSILLHIYYHLLQAPFTFRKHYLLTANKHLFPHDTFNPLFSANQWDCPTSLQVGTKYLGCVVCRFHVAAGAGSAPCQKLISNNLQKWFLSPTGRLNFGFITEGKLTAVLMIPSSWGFQLVHQHRTIICWALPGMVCLAHEARAAPFGSMLALGPTPETSKISSMRLPEAKTFP